MESRQCRDQVERRLRQVRCQEIGLVRRHIAQSAASNAGGRNLLLVGIQRLDQTATGSQLCREASVAASDVQRTGYACRDRPQQPCVMVRVVVPGPGASGHIPEARLSLPTPENANPCALPLTV